MINPEHPLPVVRQCQLLELARSTAYYAPLPTSETDLALMRRLDELHLKWPFLGARKLRDLLNRDGFEVGRKHVGTLMRKMGISAVYRAPKTSTPGHGAEHRIYPYLLKNLVIERANQVWAADITYLPMAKGFLYLVAIMDWASRRVLAWRTSNTLTAISASKRCTRPWHATAPRRSSTPTRAASSPAPSSPTSSRTPACASAWTAKGAGSTTSSSSGCGAA